MQSLLYNILRGLLSLFSLSHHLERNLNLHFLVQLHISYIVANFLNSTLDGDDLTIDLDAQLSQLVCYLHSTNRTEDGTGVAHLSSNLQTHVLQLLSLSQSLVLDLLQLVSTLSQVFSQLLLCRRRSDDSLASRDEVVTAITVLHLYRSCNPD